MKRDTSPLRNLNLTPFFFSILSCYSLQKRKKVVALLLSVYSKTFFSLLRWNISRSAPSQIVPSQENVRKFKQSIFVGLFFAVLLSILWIWAVFLSLPQRSESNWNLSFFRQKSISVLILWIHVVTTNSSVFVGSWISTFTSIFASILLCISFLSYGFGMKHLGRWKKQFLYIFRFSYSFFKVVISLLNVFFSDICFDTHANPLVRWLVVIRIDSLSFLLVSYLPHFFIWLYFLLMSLLFSFFFFKNNNGCL